MEGSGQNREISVRKATRMGDIGIGRAEMYRPR
jgi:hypothetical protein